MGISKINYSGIKQDNMPAVANLNNILANFSVDRWAWNVTSNTPYSAGLTSCGNGIVFTTTTSDGTAGEQLSMALGETKGVFYRVKRNSAWESWKVLGDTSVSVQNCSLNTGALNYVGDTEGRAPYCTISKMGRIAIVHGMLSPKATSGNQILAEAPAAYNPLRTQWLSCECYGSSCDTEVSIRSGTNTAQLWVSPGIANVQLKISGMYITAT